MDYNLACIRRMSRIFCLVIAVKVVAVLVFSRPYLSNDRAVVMVVVRQSVCNGRRPLLGLTGRAFGKTLYTNY